MDRNQQPNASRTANSFVDSLTNWSHSVSRSSRTAIAITFVLIALVLINSSGLRSAPQQCHLLNDCQLTANEIQRIEFVLNKSGFDQFEVVDGMIRVPQTERAAYLKLLTDENALPIALSQGVENQTAGLNPFLTRNQQLVAERSARRKQVEQMLGRLPFVEQAWFQMDSVKSKNAFQGPKVSAVASIQPAMQRSLDARQVNTIRQIIAGSFAALEPGQIVITDLIAGNAYHQADSQRIEGTQNVSHASRQLELAERRGYYENQISNVLKPFPGVTFDLQFESQPNPDWAETRQDTFAAVSAQVPEVINRQQTETNWGMNGQASVESPVRQANYQEARVAEGSAREQKSNFVRLDQTYRKPSMPIMRRGGTMPRVGKPNSAPNAPIVARQTQDIEVSEFIERVFVRVSVPLALVEPVSSGFDLMRTADDRTKAIETKFNKLSERIAAQINPLLPVGSFDNPGKNPVTVLLENGGPLVAVPPLIQVQQFLAQHWASVFVVLIGMLLIVAAARGGNASDTPQLDGPKLALDTLDSTVPGEPSSGVALDDGRRDVEAQLSRMIEADPDAAAKVIQNWIRDAA